MIGKTGCPPYLFPSILLLLKKKKYLISYLFCLTISSYQVVCFCQKEKKRHNKEKEIVVSISIQYNNLNKNQISMINFFVPVG